MKHDDLPKTISAKSILVLCAGYPYNTDTSFGSQVAKRLQLNGLPENAECYDVGESISEVPHLADRTDKIILVDVLQTNDPPGTIYRFKPEEVLDAAGGTVDAAKYHMLQTVYELQITGDCKEAVFIGVVPQDTATVGETLTHLLQEKIPAVVDMIMEEIRRTGE